MLDLELFMPLTNAYLTAAKLAVKPLKKLQFTHKSTEAH